MTGPFRRALLFPCHVTLAALFLPAALAQAEVALVRGGEHPDFTRIVIEADGPSDWRFGRTIDGYELDLAGVSPGTTFPSPSTKSPGIASRACGATPTAEGCGSRFPAPAMRWPSSSGPASSSST